MGREIRKVPKGWEHPKKDNGHYQPLHDENYLTAIQKWHDHHNLWLNKEHPDQLREDPPSYEYFAEWDGNPPDVEYYRKYKDEECSCFQMYETVSEGTPVSPVFDALSQLEQWIVSELGYTPTAAHNFCKAGSAPTMIMIGGKLMSGIEGYDQ